jgi:hypothetical protein
LIKYLTPDEAAEELLGWTGKRKGRALMRFVFRKEKAENREIAIRVQGEKQTRYKLTEPMLQLHLPELFSPHIEALAQELCRRIDDVRSTIGAEIDERMAPQIRQIRSSHQKLTSEVSRLAHTTNTGFSRLERRIGELERKSG